MLTGITVVVIFGSILAVFGESLPQGRFWTILRNVIFFIPILIIGVILHIAGDFKNHRLGYIVIFVIVAFLCWGMYMGYKAGPSIPDRWDN
jgi:hypothetical protein